MAVRAVQWACSMRVNVGMLVRVRHGMRAHQTRTHVCDFSRRPRRTTRAAAHLKSKRGGPLASCRAEPTEVRRTAAAAGCSPMPS